MEISNLHWSGSNPRIFYKVHRDQPQELNVCAEIFDDQLVGFFLYLVIWLTKFICNYWKRSIDPALTLRLLKIVKLILCFYKMVLFCIILWFFFVHWIERRGSFEWPPQSPDLLPFNFCLRGYQKLKYEERSQRRREICIKLTRQEMLGDERNVLNKRWFSYLIN